METLDEGLLCMSREGSDFRFGALLLPMVERRRRPVEATTEDFQRELL